MSASLAGKALLVVLAGLAGIVGLTAAAEARNPVVTIEVRVWQDVNDARDFYISARPEGGSWGTLGTRALPLDGTSSSGRFRYGDITVTVPLEGGVATDVAVRVWQEVRGKRRVYISARPEGGSWGTLGTLPLPLDAGSSANGRFRYGDARLGLLTPRGEPSWAQLPIPPVTIAFHGDFSAEDRARYERLTRQEYERVARFFARRHGVTVPGLTINVTRPDSEWDRGFAYGQKVIYLTAPTAPPTGANVSAGPGGSVTIGVNELAFMQHLPHEYVHVLQDEIADTIGGPTWIREGMAWYLEYLYEYASGFYQRYLRFFGQHLAGEQHVFELGRQSLWWRARYSTVPLEDMEWRSWDAGVGFLAMERLVERSGEASLFDFYRRYATVPRPQRGEVEDDSWREVFADTFGLSVGEFYEEFAAWRAEAVPPASHFSGVVLGPDGAPVVGSSASPLEDLDEFLDEYGKVPHVSAMRWEPGGMDNNALIARTDTGWVGVAPDWFRSTGHVKADGTFRTEAYPSESTVLVVAIPQICGQIAFVAEDGSLTRDPDAAWRFTIELDGVVGIEIRLPREIDELCPTSERPYTWDARRTIGWEQRYWDYYYQ